MHHLRYKMLHKIGPRIGFWVEKALTLPNLTQNQ
jgi:hypothetical protein